jgi:acyl-coenzyme A synthetase/AMP-(fatty) acid ligase/acyl carrier protein
VCFDLSVFELFCTLSLGGRVVLVDDALGLPALPDDADVRLINTVPSAIAELLRMDGIPNSVATINLAGEPLAPALVDQLYDVPSVNRVNDLYGPSEDTTYSTWTTREAGQPASIGRPIANTRVYLLDAHLNPTPIGVPGELCLAGSGITRGYLNQPELTNEKYLPDPFGQPGERLYRTGDLARYRTDGSLEYLGRLDHQVKLRGFRIELGEIETRLSNHDSVATARVVIREDTPEDKTLVAYVVPAEDSVDVATLRAHVQAGLPNYMVPQAIVSLDEIPLTPNGKLDRKALPAPDGSAKATETYVAPSTPVEQALAEIWQQLLNVEQVGVHDDFFALGGHSLMTIRLITELSEASGQQLSIADVFEQPTIAELATVFPADTHFDIEISAPINQGGISKRFFRMIAGWFSRKAG